MVVFVQPVHALFGRVTQHAHSAGVPRVCAMYSSYAGPPASPYKQNLASGAGGYGTTSAQQHTPAAGGTNAPPPATAAESYLPSHLFPSAASPRPLKPVRLWVVLCMCIHLRICSILPLWERSPFVLHVCACYPSPSACMCVSTSSISCGSALCRLVRNRVCIYASARVALSCMSTDEQGCAYACIATHKQQRTIS